MEINPNLRISTLTLISKISSNINLLEFYNNVTITDDIKFIEYGTNPTKGESSKKKKKGKRFFYNQITLHVYLDKLVNVKLFNNGRIQMTGLKSKKQGIDIIHIILLELKKLPAANLSNILDNSNPEIVDSYIVLINSDFDLKFKIKREKLQRIIIDKGYYSSYEPIIYPGVNIKYYFNKEKQQNGICNCENLCNGKGKNGLCKKVTVAVFNSGKIIITGGQSYEQLNTAYQFINDLIKENKEELMVKENREELMVK